MKKWLIIAGFVGAFAFGSMTTGSIFSFANSDTSTKEPSPNTMNGKEMMDMNQGSEMKNMMEGQSDNNMNEMMGTMSIMGDVMSDLSKEASQKLGIEPDQLQKELESGKSLATISEAKGVPSTKLIKDLEKIIQEDVKKFKKDGRLTNKEQEKMMTAMSKNIGMMVNAKGMFACNGMGESI